MEIYDDGHAQGNSRHVDTGVALKHGESVVAVGTPRTLIVQDLSISHVFQKVEIPVSSMGDKDAQESGMLETLQSLRSARSSENKAQQVLGVVQTLSLMMNAIDGLKEAGSTLYNEDLSSRSEFFVKKLKETLHDAEIALHNAEISNLVDKIVQLDDEEGVAALQAHMTKLRLQRKYEKLAQLRNAVQ